MEWMGRGVKLAHSNRYSNSHRRPHSFTVLPAQAGIQNGADKTSILPIGHSRIPACAGMTVERSNPLTHRNILRLGPALLAAIFIAIATAACAGPDLSGVEQGIADNAAAIEELRPAADAEPETMAAAQSEVEALLARLLLDEVAIAELRQEMDSNRSAILAERRDLNELLDRLQLDEAAIAELRAGLAAEHAALVADEALIAALSDRLDLGRGHPGRTALAGASRAGRH